MGAGLTCLSVALAGAVGVPAQAAPWDDASRMCRIKDTRIVENSGMSRSTYGRRTLFVHNDSGGGAEFFAIRAHCGTKAVFTVPGAPAKDWEDMASGPDHTLWFGDIGGNRSEVNVVRVKEPRTLRSRALRHTAYRLRYPDGAHNAEAMMIRPRSGRLYVITKAASNAGIYRAPKQLKRRGVNQLTRIGDAPDALSGADFSRTGRLFVLRGYHVAFVYRSIGDVPTRIELPAAHTFGEAVTFDRSGGMVFGAEGVREWLWRIT
jgi:hypothetical protein